MRENIFNRWLHVRFSKLFTVNHSRLATIVIAIIITSSALASTDEKYESGIMNIIKNIWYYVYPPQNYSNLLVDEEINISTPGETYRFEFINKYKGNHSAGMFLSGFYKGGILSEEYLKNHKFALKAEIYFYINDHLALSKTADGTWSPFSSSNGGGLIFFYYKTPTELPINKPISCVVKIIEPDKSLSDTYGPTRFYIGKESDQ